MIRIAEAIGFLLSFPIFVCVVAIAWISEDAEEERNEDD